MSPPLSGNRAPASSGARSRLLRLFAIGLALLGLALGGLTVAAWLSQDEPALPFDYGGFD